MDYEKAKELACKSCTRPTQVLRNCSGSGRPAQIPINDAIYTECPRAITLRDYSARYIVNVYYHCKENKTFPAPGGLLNQTAFTLAAFDFIDEIIANAKLKRHAATNAPKK